VTSSSRRSISSAVLLFVCLLGAASAFAGSFQVSPVRATLGPSRTVEALTVRNDGPEPAVVQLEAMAWSQKDGKDVYEPTKDLIATPPIFTVPPGGSQIIRVGLRRAPERDRELSYRLYLQEVPPAPRAGFQGLQVALRLGVPVFVNPPGEAKPSMKWQARRGPDGQLQLSLSNSGNAHVQVANFTLAGANGAPVASQHVSSYVLAGQRRDWAFKASPMPAPGTALKLRAQTDAGDVAADVLVEKP
jgi:fimbrial chaperone protein